MKNICLSAACLSIVGVGCGVDATGSSTVGEAIVGGTSETAINAIVQINYNGEGCSGTLVRPDLVLTNGHCFPGGGGMVSNYGKWNEFAAGDAWVGVGPIGASPTFTTTAHWYMQPPAAPDGMGQDDVVLIGLASTVPANKATWLRVATNAPGLTPLNPSPNWINTVAGWGEYYAGHTTTRLQGNLSNAFQTCSGQINMRIGNWILPATGGTPGDSGSPFLLPSGVGSDIPGPSGRVVGGVYGNSSCGGGGYLTTWTTGDFTKPNISAWLTNNGTRSFCAQRGTMDSADGHFRRLMNWWSDARLDNHASTDDGYFGCYDNWTDVIYPGGPYGFNRQEGWVADRAEAPPAGTVPLYLYWNSSTKDNATVTGAAAPSSPWVIAELLGHIWTATGTDRVALRAWYNSTIQDYFTTISTEDYSGAGYARWPLGSSGIMGYVRTNGSVP